MADPAPADADGAGPRRVNVDVYDVSSPAHAKGAGTITASLPPTTPPATIGSCTWPRRPVSRCSGRTRSVAGHRPRLLYAKGALFVFLGAAASAAILLEQPSLRIAALLAVAVWAFARAYSFAFYVVEHYVDGRYRFAGLTSFVVYLVRRGKGAGVSFRA